MPAGAATGQRRIRTLLHPRKPCSRKAVRLTELCDLFLVLLPIDRFGGRESRTTLPAEGYRPFSIPAVAGRNRTTSYCVTNEIPPRPAQICCGIKGGSCSPAAGGEVASSCTVRNTYMRVPGNAEALLMPRHAQWDHGRRLSICLRQIRQVFF